jgi:tetraacyldisaccharide 4'-kinase
MARMDSAPSFRERLVRDWYLPRPTLLTAALLPLSWLFRGMAGVRRSLYCSGLWRTASLPVPVVVVGNITAGGTGKTPLVAWLVRALREHGLHPGIVSRGHGGVNATPRAVQAGDDPCAAGDEPLLLARTGSPVWIGRDRVAAARALLGSHPGIDVIVSDDGLQHYRLPRAVEIVVVDGQRGFGNGALLPAGPLREPLARANSVDAIVVNGAQSNAGAMIAIDVPVFAMRLTGERFVSLVDATRAVGAEVFRGQRVHAIAGIGNPERFFGSLRALGLDPVCHAFPDHHAYTAPELALPDAQAILMTDKDAIKCQALADARMWTLPVEAAVGPGLIERILEKMHGRQAA